MKSAQHRKIEIDNTYHRIVSILVKNDMYFKLPVGKDSNFKYNSCVSGINEHSYYYDDISKLITSVTYYFHYFSYEFDDILEEYKKENNITSELNIYTVHELFVKYKDTLNDLSWIITNCDIP
jgi:hypothetical protein